ncbi:MAG: hypothetical protein KIT58_15265 [Planctomycetota bacterium]|nr:hypothetical protein [Planctomycetota bacterium]
MEEGPLRFRTEQEELRATEFGDEYSRRNARPDRQASNLAFFSRARGIRAGFELGANIGLNRRALQLLFPEQRQYALEDPSAAAELRRDVGPDVADDAFTGSILEFTPSRAYDTALITGVLIHSHLDVLSRAYDVLETFVAWASAQVRGVPGGRRAAFDAHGGEEAP